MKTYDKASWQIDGGIPKESVHSHFKIMFEWLEVKGFLNSEGKEILELGDFSDASLNESLLTKSGNDFLAKNYDQFIKEVPYGDLSIQARLDNIFN